MRTIFLLSLLTLAACSGEKRTYWSAPDTAQSLANTKRACERRGMVVKVERAGTRPGYADFFCVKPPAR